MEQSIPEQPIPENPWPALRIIAVPVSFGPAITIGYMCYDRLIAHHHRIVPWPSVLGVALFFFGLLYVTIALIIRPDGQWTQSETGLRFAGSPARTNPDRMHRVIPWSAIYRMNSTGASLVIRWNDLQPEGDTIQRKDVLLLEKSRAAALIDTWKKQTGHL